MRLEQTFNLLIIEGKVGIVPLFPGKNTDRGMIAEKEISSDGFTDRDKKGRRYK